jgi:hypothetical protein
MRPPLCKDTAFVAKYGQAALSTLYLIVNLIQVSRSVNLNKLKQQMARVLNKKGKQTAPNSHYKRLNRFFQDFGDDPEFFEAACLLLVQKLRAKGHKVLLLDGTKWDLDNKHLHYLTLSILVRGVSIPIYFVDLEKAGASSQEERIAFIEKALEKFDLKGMTLIADREYIGDKWFKYLIDNGLNFIIRLKKGDYEIAYNLESGAKYDKNWQKCLRTGRSIAKTIKLLSMPYTVVMCQNRDKKAEDKTVFLISNLTNKNLIASTYLLRWQIERMFKQLKSDGFELEDINLKSKGRRCLLVLLVCMAHALTIQAALDKHRTFKKVDRQNGTQHLRESVFQIGLSLMVKHTRTLQDFWRYIGQFFLDKNPLLNQNV